MQLRPILAAAFCLAGGAFAQDAPKNPSLETFLKTPQIWSTTPEALLHLGKGFEWTSEAQDSLRSADPGLSFGGLRIWETIARFSTGEFKELTMNFYDRGDAGDTNEREFEKLLGQVTGVFTTFVGKAPVDRGKDASNVVRARGLVWETPETTYTMEWSFTRKSTVKMIPFRGEFIRVRAVPTPKRAAIGASELTKRGARGFQAQEHVVKTPEGEVKITDVPMVDQGDKGYCVVAAVERIMAYYETRVDQHELAQIANTDASEGTSHNALLNSLKKLTSRLGVRIKRICDMEIDDFLKLVADYNRLAHREKMSEVNLGGPSLDLAKCYKQMDLSLLSKTRLKDTGEFNKFQRGIQENIDEGIPLLWTVVVGVVKEKELPADAFGGHMRLIIGYNNSTKEILYSDTWGKGHEEKRMSLEDAWAMTISLSVLQPLQ